LVPTRSLELLAAFPDRVHMAAFFPGWEIVFHVFVRCQVHEVRGGCAAPEPGLDLHSSSNELGPFLVGVDFGVGKAAVVIADDVDVVESDARTAGASKGPRASLRHRGCRPVLNVDMDEFSGLVTALDPSTKPAGFPKKKIQKCHPPHGPVQLDGSTRATVSYVSPANSW
jgi:hypothetical protein